MNHDSTESLLLRGRTSGESHFTKYKIRNITNPLIHKKCTKSKIRLQIINYLLPIHFMGQYRSQKCQTLWNLFFFFKAERERENE